MSPRVPGSLSARSGGGDVEPFEHGVDGVLFGLPVEEDHGGVAGRSRGAEGLEQRSKDLHAATVTDARGVAATGV